MTTNPNSTQSNSNGRIDEASIGALRSGLRGRLTTQADEGYEQARAVYNAMIDRHPILIAHCVDVADVITSVRFARDHELPLAVRGGGHNGGGLGTVDDGLVIDLSPMKGVRVDPAKRALRAGGGCTWGDVDHASHVFGLATPSGIISTTGVGGLTLGGGIGHLSRAHGLSIDNLLEADVVLADGRFVTAKAEQNQDLFWALRGGGGNFGVVTSFSFALHPVDMVYAGPMLWPLEQAADAMRFYRDFLAAAADDVSGFFAFLVVPPRTTIPEHLHNQNMCGVVWCYTGPMNKAEQVFEPIRKFGPPALDLVGPLPHPALQGMFDALYPPGLQWYWKADFVNELSDEAIALHMRHGSQVPNMHSTMHLYPISGVVHHVAEEATAFSYRESGWAEVIVGVDWGPTKMGSILAWVRDYWSALHPHSAGGAYVNFMMDEGEDRVKATYRGNYARLAEIKKQYDPTNLFHVNQNIRPAA